MPEAISDLEPTISSGLAKLLSRADAAIADLNRTEPAGSNRMEVLARQLLRQESLASSRIEGLALPQERLGRAAFDPAATDDRVAREVLANIDAMQAAIDDGSNAGAVTVDGILNLHWRLMKDASPSIAGKVRRSQNWVGGGWHNPAQGEFVPPPEDEVEPLLEDLARFMSLPDLPPSLQAAIAHAQFETIHPFADGNGRVGRCLIHLIHRRNDTSVRHVPPISIVLAADVDRYVQGLTAYRAGDVDGWVSYFAQVTLEACDRARALARSLEELARAWHDRARPRRGSAAESIMEHLPSQPVIDVALAAEITGRSQEAARLALNSLTDLGVLREVTGSRWGRIWEASEVWELLERAEGTAAR